MSDSRSISLQDRLAQRLRKAQEHRDQARRDAAQADPLSQPDGGPAAQSGGNHENYCVDQWGQGWWGDGTPDVSNWPSG